uniref:NADH-ubiquinone oxidoreductase chain 5 n=1 Tax=Trigonopterus triradiatus TaxID=2678947 RepID=A0A7H1KHX3_9CUCU|nr:NADH dehydrogenase subunit 5 [Trigonopterus triradiatus]QNT26889.1 NADH dehydrogenase subunit 5 [Trigonopterus triradiatus]
MLMYLLNFFVFLVVALVLYFYSLLFLYDNKVILVEMNFLSLNSLGIEFSILVDWVSLMFSSFVFYISALIISYSMEYMSGDKNLKRFIYLMVLFVLSMITVIMSTNLVCVLLGWDGLGLVSYALVIYYQNSKSFNAGMLTALSNRIGDACILLGIVILMDTGGWNYQMIVCFSNWKGSYLCLGLLIICASFTKSAQIPFSAWLPAAMAAPTPVSSLVHSSTLVTAGVYMLFRFSDLLTDNLKTVFMVFSLLTMFMAGVAANLEYDLKKIIALSTLSQLGMMMVIFFCGSKDLAFFHLLMHALFKALLFMCSGFIIHSVMGCQDIRFMGNLAKIFPITCSCFCVSNLALCGLPFLSGFYSKDLIAEVFSMEISSMLIYTIFYFSIGLTVSYSMRLFIYVFMGEVNMTSLSMLVESSSKIMVKAMAGMVVLVIFKGSMYLWVGVSTPYFVVLPVELKMMTLFMILLGGILGAEISFLGVMKNSSLMSIFQFTMFSSGMWNIPILSTSTFNTVFLTVGKQYLKSVDYGWTEFYGSKGLFSLVKDMSMFLQFLSYNHLKVFLLVLWGFFIFVMIVVII